MALDTIFVLPLAATPSPPPIGYLSLYFKKGDDHLFVLDNAGNESAFFSTASAIPLANLAQNNATTGQALMWNGAAWAPTSALPLSSLAQGSATTNQVVAWNGTTWAPANVSGITVTSVGLALPNIFTVSGSPITSAGTITATLASQNQNLVFASPAGSSGAPAFRSLLPQDIPALSYVTSIALSMPAEFSVSGSPISSNGTLSVSKANQSANLIYAGPTTGAAAAPTFRSLVAADIPGLPGSIITSGQVSGSFLQAINLSATGNGGITGTLPINAGGTAVTSVTTSPTASAWAGWDTNKNLSANNLIESYTTTATAAGTTTLTVGSTYQQYFTGTTTQTVLLPVTSTLVAGQQFLITNLSTGVVTVQSSGGNTLQAMAQNSQLLVTCVSTTGTGTASWNWTYTPATSGTLPITNGGTGQTTQQAALNALAPPGPTNGQVISFNGTNWVASTPAAGTKNYLTAIQTSNGTNTGNGNFEFGTTTGWSLFNTTVSGSVPTGSITAGAASLTTFSIITSGQLAGTSSLQVGTTSGTAWASGQGFISDAFFIDNEDQTKMLQVKLYYSCTAGASNLNWSGTTANNLAIAIYDVTGSAWIQPQGSFNFVQSSGAGYATATFQTTKTSTQYRIAILNVNGTAAGSTGATTVVFDDIYVGPQIAPMGAPATDPVAYTPTFTGFGTVSAVEFYSYRDGAYLIVEGNFTSGTSTAAEARISLGFNGINGGITSQAIPNIRACGDYFIGATATSHGGAALIEPSQTYLTLGDPATFGSTSVNPLTKANASSITASGNKVSIYARIPVAGWSSNVQMSSDTDTRVVAMTAYAQTPTGTLGSAWNIVKFGTVSKDTNSTYSVTTGLYTAAVSGWYQVSGTIEISHVSVAIGNQFGLGIGLNGGVQHASAKRADSTSNTTQYLSVSGEVYLNAGDTTGLYSWTNGTTPSFSNGFTASSFSVQRVSGPSAIAATETVAARYTNSAGTTLTKSAANTVPFATKDYDTHGAWNGTDTFTCPVSGKFAAKVTLTIASGATWAAGDVVELDIMKNGANHTNSFLIIMGSVTGAINVVAVGTLNCIAGDTIKLNCTPTKASAGNVTLNTTAAYNSIAIERIGN